MRAATREVRGGLLEAASGEGCGAGRTMEPEQPETSTGAPRGGKEKGSIGKAGADGGVRGDGAADAVESGELGWRCDSVPGEPEKPQESAALERARATWSGDEWHQTVGGGTGGNARAGDPERNRRDGGTGNGTPGRREQRSPGGGTRGAARPACAGTPRPGRRRQYQTTPGDAVTARRAISML